MGSSNKISFQQAEAEFQTYAPTGELLKWKSPLFIVNIEVADNCRSDKKREKNRKNGDNIEVSTATELRVSSYLQLIRSLLTTINSTGKNLTIRT